MSIVENTADLVAPVAPSDSVPARELSTFKKLAGSLDEAYHSPVVLLDCLVEQVGEDIKGKSDGFYEAKQVTAEESERLSRYIEKLKENWGIPEEEEKSDTCESDTNPYCHLEEAVLSSLDAVGCRFKGVRMFGHTSVAGIAKKVEELFRVPECQPDTSKGVLTVNQRRAMRTKIFPFMPKRISHASVERLLLLKEFAQLLSSVMPTKGKSDPKGNCELLSLSDRLVHEKIPMKLLKQRLGRLVYGGGASRMCQYAWKQQVELGHQDTKPTEESETAGDGQGEAEADEPETDTKTEEPRYEVREVFEKCLVPSDGSVIISSRITRTALFDEAPIEGVEVDEGADEVKGKEESEEPVKENDGLEEATREEQQFRRQLVYSRRVSKAFVKGCTLTANRSQISCLYEDGSRVSVDACDDGQFTVSFSPTLATNVKLLPDCSVNLEPARPPGYGVPTMPNARCGDMTFDPELRRRIFPKSGVVLRVLASGRKEVMYPDGTFSYRDPLPEELAFGMRLPVGSRPGEWIVVKARTGAVYRRWKRPVRPQESTVDATKADVDENEGAEGNIDEHLINEEMRKYEDEMRHLVEGGMCEEKLETVEVPTAIQTDSETGSEIITNEHGLMIISAHDGLTRTVIFPDHTRFITRKNGGREDISISKLGWPLCTMTNDKLTLELEDGSKVMSQYASSGCEMLLEKATDGPSVKVDAKTGHFTLIGTPYIGEFRITKFGSSFVLSCHDAEGNAFEIDGRTNRCSVKLATCLDETKAMESPRPGLTGAESLPNMTAMYHPDKDFLPSVNGLVSHPPRLIVVYGNGRNEAE
ncbi:hypothetical protein FOL47_003709, partial [Perkinsus chesapeaki]